jgi:hypothetical protein
MLISPICSMSSQTIGVGVGDGTTGGDGMRVGVAVAGRGVDVGAVGDTAGGATVGSAADGGAVGDGIDVACGNARVGGSAAAGVAVDPEGRDTSSQRSAWYDAIASRTQSHKARISPITTVQKVRSLCIVAA